MGIDYHQVKASASEKFSRGWRPILKAMQAHRDGLSFLTLEGAGAQGQLTGTYHVHWPRTSRRPGSDCIQSKCWDSPGHRSGPVGLLTPLVPSPNLHK